MWVSLFYRINRLSALRGLANRLRAWWQDFRLSSAGRLERANERRGQLPSDPGIDPTVDACIDWLRFAQDNSASRDGGVARDYSFVSGWAASYPETTGYIIPTMLLYAQQRKDSDARERARRMLDWLVSIQFPDGGFPGGKIDDRPQVPVVFNTGQVVLGLVAGQREFAAYREPLIRAADWLVAAQDADGCWRRYPSPFCKPGDKVFDTHVAWALLEAARLEPGRAYRDAAMANLQWALTHQDGDGWFDECCLNDKARPLTHTLGYALRGFLEGYRASNDAELLHATRLTADGLLGSLTEDGFLPGRLRQGWRPAVDWACLTGMVQIAYCWLELYRLTGEARYLETGRRANAFVRRTVRVDGPSETRGGVKGSYPINGDYGRYSYLSWAVKFCIDSNLLESSLCG